MNKINISTVTIIPLSQDNIREALVLIEAIFSYESDQKNARFTLYDSLGNQEYGQRYWIAVTENNKVIGITGLYKDWSDRSVVWLGWFGVHTEFRLHGIGSKLLEYAISKAKQEGYVTLRLFTSSDPNERAAHKLYKKFGFTQIEINKSSDKIYFEKKLKAI